MSGGRKLSLAEVNALGYDAFTARFGNVVEHFPVAAAAAWDRRPYRTAADLHGAVCAVLDAAGVRGRRTGARGDGTGVQGVGADGTRVEANGTEVQGVGADGTEVRGDGKGVGVKGTGVQQDGTGVRGVGADGTGIQANSTNNFPDVSSSIRAGVLRCHPDLAGRLAKSGELSAESTNEQRTAGLLDITESEARVLDDLNRKYRTKFGFPFVICVRENKKAAILAGLERRLRNDRDTELDIGIEEVKKIAWIRICDIIEDAEVVAKEARL